MSLININQIKRVEAFISLDRASTVERIHLCVSLTTMPIDFLSFHNWNDVDNFN